MQSIYQHSLNSSTKQYKLITYRISGDQCDNNFKNMLENHNWDELQDIVDVDTAFEQFNTVLGY